jgi:hypothetical protein
MVDVHVNQTGTAQGSRRAAVFRIGLCWDKSPSLVNGGRSRQTKHFRWPANRLFSVNESRLATMLNANMVNGDSMVHKLPVFWQKNAF